MIALSLAAAAALDAGLGELRYWHPLVGFGDLAGRVEQRLRRLAAEGSRTAMRRRGVAAVALLLVPLVAMTWALVQLPYLGQPLAVALLYLALGNRSLAQHGTAVRQALQRQKLSEARRALAYIVSRDTRELDAEGVARGTVESVLENGNDAVFGALFWFVVAGAPGVVCYRLANTLDAMWGYRNARYRDFGWAAARLDDLLNYLPARLTVLTYAALGHSLAALRCAFRQGRYWKSPNAGPVMAAGAGALGVSLGGAAVYHGHKEVRPSLGIGTAPGAADIGRAVALVNRGMMLWIVCVAAVEAAISFSI